MTRIGWMARGALLLVLWGCEDTPPPLDGATDAEVEADGATDAGAASLTDDLIDRDGDGVVDARDAFPLDPSEAFDSDGDGVGNAAQADEDGDGTPDALDAAPFDADRSAPRIVDEAEPVAEAGAPPQVLRGRLDDDADVDTFVIDAAAGTPLLARLVADPSAAPRLRLTDASGAPWLVPESQAEEGPGLARARLALVEDGVRVEVRARGGAPFDYVVHVAIDGDADGIDDAVELALGCDPERPDHDEDGLVDGDELLDGALAVRAALDPDGDGALAFADLDADDDGLPDGLEGTADADDDGTPSFLDLDSDGDGRADADARGDLDGDGLEDAIDADSDGDGLLERNDLAPSEPLPYTDAPILAGPLVLSTATEIAGGRAEETAHPDGTFVLEGSGFGASAGDVWVLLAPSGGGAPLNVRPSAATDARLEVALPDVLFSRVAVATRTARTPWIPVHGALRGDPVLTGVSPSPARLGDPITLTGANLERLDQLQVIAGDGTPRYPELTRVSDAEVTFTTFDAETGPLTLLSLREGDADVRRRHGGTLQLARPLSTYVVLPAGVSFALTDLVTSSDGAEPTAVGDAGDVTFEIAHGQDQLVSVALPDPGGGRATVVLSAITRSGYVDRVDARSTAIATAVMITGALDRLSGSALNRAVNDAAALPEITALADEIALALARDPRSVESPDATLGGLIAAAADAFSREILGTTAFAPVGAARITEERFGVRVTEQAGRGNLSVDNDTSMFLSVRVRDEETDQILLDHVNGVLDPAIIGSQWGLFGGASDGFYASNVVDLDQPRYRNAVLEVVTAGTLSALPADADEATRSAYYYVGLRSFLEKVMLNAFSYALGRVIPSASFINAFVQQFATEVETVRDLFAMGRPSQGWAVLWTAVRNDLENVGPFTRAIGRLIGAGVGLTAAIRIGAKLVPVVGWISAAIDVIAGVVTGLNVGQYATDVLITPPTIRFEAHWDLAVDYVLPRHVIPDQSDRRVILEGARFDPQELTATEERLPEIVFTNDDAGELVLTPTRIWPDGTRMETVLPGAYLDRARDTIGVSVRHRGEQVSAAEGITTIDGRRILELDPPAGRDGSIVTIRGGVYSGDRRLVSVYFASTQDETDVARVVHRAEVLSATPTELRVLVPRGLAGGPADTVTTTWHVFANIGPAGFAESTNYAEYRFVPSGTWVYGVTNASGTYWGTWRWLDPASNPGGWHLAVHSLPSGEVSQYAWWVRERSGTPERQRVRLWSEYRPLGCCWISTGYTLDVDLVAGTFTGQMEEESGTTHPVRGYIVR